MPADAAGAELSEALPQLLVFAANGSSPLRESITGIPIGKIAAYSNFGACGGAETAFVLNSLTGAVTVPTTPSGGGPSGFLVDGLWFDPAGTAYASFVPNPSDCATSGGPPPSPRSPATPIVCKLVGGQWVRTGEGASRAAYADGGWLAQQTGPASPVSAPASLVISHGTTAITVPNVTTFAWAPDPARSLARPG